MNRKKHVMVLLSQARAAERKGDYAASFFILGSALALSDEFEVGFTTWCADRACP